MHLAALLPEIQGVAWLPPGGSSSLEGSGTYNYIMDMSPYPI